MSGLIEGESGEQVVAAARIVVGDLQPYIQCCTGSRRLTQAHTGSENNSEDSNPLISDASTLTRVDDLTALRT